VRNANTRLFFFQRRMRRGMPWAGDPDGLASVIARETAIPSGQAQKDRVPAVSGCAALVEPLPSGESNAFFQRVEA